MTIPLHDALAVQKTDGRVVGTVHEGFDVFGIPHGGYLLALGANAILVGTEQPDIFTITAHYLRKAVPGPMRFDLQSIGGSRRFTTVSINGIQDGAVVLALMASVGDRTLVTGPQWSGVDPVEIPPDRLEHEREDFTPPNIATAMRTRFDSDTTGFITGSVGEHGRVRAVAEPDRTDQLSALIACDVTPPAVWNALGAKGWVPTIELTAHVRARPTEGPLTVEVVTDHVSDGFLNEDALVYDSAGTLVVQSRQLAMWSGAP